MNIGGLNITREDMPSFSFAKDNPSHMYASMQDILRKSQQTNLTNQQQSVNAYTNDPETDIKQKDERSSVWK